MRYAIVVENTENNYSADIKRRPNLHRTIEVGCNLAQAKKLQMHAKIKLIVEF